MSRHFSEKTFNSLQKLKGNRKARRAQSKLRTAPAVAADESSSTYLLDRLEPRILMDATPLRLTDFAAVTTDGAVQATVKLSSSEVSSTKVYNYSIYDITGATFIAGGQIASTEGLNILGGDQADRIKLSFEAGFDTRAVFTVSVDGGAGNDIVTLASFENGYLGSLNLSAESVTVSAAIGAADAKVKAVTITAQAVKTLDDNGSASVSGVITLSNSIYATGTVSLLAQASITGTKDFTGIAATGSPSITTVARIVVSEGVTVDAGAISLVTGAVANVTEKTNNRLLFVATGTVSSTSRVEIGAGAQLLSSQVGGITVSATDDTDVTVDVSALELSVGSETVFAVNALSVDLDIEKSVGVTLGSTDTGKQTAILTASGSGGISLTAQADGSVLSKVNSSFLGISQVDLTGTSGGVLIDVNRATLTAGGNSVRGAQF